LSFGILTAVFVLIKLFQSKDWTVDQTLDLCIWLIVGGLLGARLGEIFFYNFSFYWQNPLEIFFINHGGLSSHGMALGLVLTLIVYCFWKKYDFWLIADALVVVIPLLAGFIRLGNFFNSEILGRISSVPWGVYFPRAEIFPLLRHPVQIYEALSSFLVFVIFYFIYKKYSKTWSHGFIFNLFLLVYFSIRFCLEFFKEYQTSWESYLTVGQWLSFPFILFSGVWLSYRLMKKRRL